MNMHRWRRLTWAKRTLISLLTVSFILIALRGAEVPMWLELGVFMAFVVHMFYVIVWLDGREALAVDIIEGRIDTHDHERSFKA